jgi:hypothetical protein
MHTHNTHAHAHAHTHTHTHECIATHINLSLESQKRTGQGRTAHTNRSPLLTCSTVVLNCFLLSSVVLFELCEYLGHIDPYWMNYTNCHLDWSPRYIPSGTLLILIPTHPQCHGAFRKVIVSQVHIVIDRMIFISYSDHTCIVANKVHRI